MVVKQSTPSDMEHVDEKDTRYKRGHKNFKIKKNLRCANCSPQVCVFFPKMMRSAKRKAKSPGFMRLFLDFSF